MIDDEETMMRLLEELDRLEDLLEEMIDLGVATRQEAERRLSELNTRIDALEQA